MKITKIQWTGIITGALLMILSLFLIKTEFFFFLIGLGIIAAITPFVILIIQINKANAEKEEMFLEFARSLVESVKTGTPVSKSIINSKNKSFGLLSPHINKLANQISMGIPLTYALKIFSEDINNKTISKAIVLISQAEKAGGDIGVILESVAGAVKTSDKLKKERKAAVSALVAQGYIIFFIFALIVIIMQFKIMPMLEGIGTISLTTTSSTLSNASGGDSSGGFDSKSITNSFLYLFIAQGFFTGLVIGKLSEGSIKSGVKHSFTIMLISFLISTGANILFN